jgi:hypothetical protein
VLVLSVEVMRRAKRDVGIRWRAFGTRNFA